MAEVEAKQKAVGNALSSSKEEYIAQILKEKNLASVNRESAPVQPKKNLYTGGVKRALDFVIALVAFLLVSPINLALAVCTFFDVGRPIIFKQTRVGLDGKEFQIIKFRNMTNATDENGNLLPANQRVTKFGKFVRKYSLDELMNFWSVLKGDMSIIGPRPLPVFFSGRLSERHKMRNAVRPGLECPRVMRDDSKPKYQVQFENDVWYVEHISFRTDLYLIWKLIRMVFNTKKRSKAALASSYFVGYDDNHNAIGLKQFCEENPAYERQYEEACAVRERELA